MLKRFAMVLIGIFVILLFFAVTINNYSRNFAFQERLEQRLATIERNQQEILDNLKRKRTVRPSRKKAEKRPPVNMNKVHNINIDQSPVKGDPQGKVTIVEFSDFQCPYSQKFHSIFMEVVNSYPSGVRYVFKSFPLSYHKEARSATKVLLVAEEKGKYWEMMDLLFDNAKNLSKEKYNELAVQLGFDTQDFLEMLQENDASYEKSIKKDIAIAREVGVRGTPTFFINGKRTSARSAEDLKKEINKLLE